MLNHRHRNQYVMNWRETRHARDQARRRWFVAMALIAAALVVAL